MTPEELLELAQNRSQQWEPFTQNHDPSFWRDLRGAYGQGFTSGWSARQSQLEYQTATNEQADRIIAGLRVANERLTAELDQLRAGLDDLLAKLRQDEALEVVRVTGHSEWPGE